MQGIKRDSLMILIERLKAYKQLSLIVLALVLSACNTIEVKTTSVEPIKIASQVLPDEVVPDVGIVLFNPGLENLEDDKYLITTTEIRNSESRYLSVQLSDVLTNTGAWGAVRIVPGTQTISDVYVHATILRSDGEVLKLGVKVEDIAGRLWFERQYQEAASQFNYEGRESQRKEPFQSVFHRIANDMLAHREQMQQSDLARLRQVSDLRFAMEFAPGIFGDYLAKNKQGVYEVQRLPSDNDPYIRRLEAIRERDDMYIDTLQDHYYSFVRSVKPPYWEWRRQSYYEIVALEETRRTSRNEIIAGVATVIAGVAAGTAGESSAVRTAGAVGTAAGGYLFLRGLNRQSEVNIHIESLIELSESLQAELEPQVIELENRTYTLQGTVEQQYDQWRALLKQVYEEETGL